MRAAFAIIPMLLFPAAGGRADLPRPDLVPGTVVRLSQTDPSGYRAVREAGNGPGIILTFPPVEMVSTPDPAVRLAGRAAKGTEIRVDGRAAKVHPTGSFVALVPLSEGENTITVSARGGNGETVYPLAIRRERPAAASRDRVEFLRPRPGRVGAGGTPLRFLPAGPRILELPAGTALSLTGEEGRWLRVSLGGGREGWVAAGAVAVEDGPPPEPVRVGGVSFDGERSSAWFSLPEPVPARVDYHSPEELDLIFENAVPASETIDLGRWEGSCLPASTGDGSAVFRLRGGLDCYRWSLEWLPGGCRLSWRGRPRRGEGPVCLDPGHGGENRGAVSPGGIAEKDANLALAREVADRLGEAGVETFLTRDGDRTLGLGERIALARERGAGVFVSLHYNSVGAGRDPLAGTGYVIFYYQSPGRELAGEIHRALEAAGRPGVGVRRQSLAVLRPTDLVSALVETAYLSHPGDEAEILDPEVRTATAEAIAAGILGYLEGE